MHEQYINAHSIPRQLLKECKLPNNVITARKNPKKYGHNHLNVKDEDPFIKIKGKDLCNSKMLLSLRKYVNDREKVLQKIYNGVSLRHRYKVQANDIHRRRFVKDPIDNVRTVLDTDKKFFDLVDGRPIAHHVSLFKSYQQMYQNILFFKHDAGYLKDQALNIGIKIEGEQKLLKKASATCKSQVNDLDMFIMEDYSNSMKLLRNADDMRYRVHLARVEFRQLSAHMGYIRSRILALNDKYALQKRYQRFLYTLSPESWRVAHGVGDLPSCSPGDDEDDSLSVIMTHLQAKSARCTPVTPALYFTDPEDLMEVYDFFENRNFAYLEHVTRTSISARRLRDAARSTRMAIERERALVEAVIGETSGLIVAELARGDDLQATFYRILDGPLNECVVSSAVLGLKTNLEYCFEKLSGEPAGELSLRDLAKYLADQGIECGKSAFNWDSWKVRRAIRKSVAARKANIKVAVRARKELLGLDRVTRRLRLACTPLPTTVAPCGPSNVPRR